MPGRIQSIERAAAILRLLSGRARRLGVAELAGELELPKGTVHGILRTLQVVGYVEQDQESGKYQLGPALLHMGSSYLDGNELRKRALNWADSLATQSGESVRIGTLHENQVLIVHHVFRPDNTRQALEVGALMPAHATALGKALLARHSYVAAELAGRGRLVAYTPETVTDVYRLRQELEEVSRRGWASEVGELVPGRASIAAPVEDGRRLTVGAIGITGSIDRLCDDGRLHIELVEYVTGAARAVSRELGAIPW
ncbi:MAG: IclR family transcriptional regulator [Solirubrobacterales bacterium]|nr:IclR family transcriptional regulator [Solirubrobacterales bacterium]MBV9717645.1 IclR family transcriptional regulator [Solirubrobacterales bacterium]